MEKLYHTNLRADAVKKNQIKLYEHIEGLVKNNHPLQTHQVTQKAHGRMTNWIVKMYDNVDEILKQNWINLNRFIVIEKSVTQYSRPNRKTPKQLITTQSISYRISDVKLSAEVFAKGIREHWGIENRIHWVKSDRRCGCKFQ